MTSVFVVSGSLVLTFAFLAVGISFFGPFWLSNTAVVYSSETNFTGKGDYIQCACSNNSTNIGLTNGTTSSPNNTSTPSNIGSGTTCPGSDCIGSYTDRGLWAQCGLTCFWFWGSANKLQNNLFTPLKWHLATQVLYFIGATLILFTEIYARVQLCFKPRTSVYISIGVMLFISAMIQVAAVAVFGGGACRYPYSAISDPRIFTIHLGQGTIPTLAPYLGWCYWMAVVGAMLTVVSAILFTLGACFGKTSSAAKY